MKSILITLVHNNDAERTKTARKVIHDLAALIGNEYDVTSLEVSYQAVNSPVSTAIARQKRSLFNKAVRKWDKYMGRKKALWWLKLYGLLAHLIRHQIFRSKPTKDERLRYARELNISNKHLMAWNSFLESGKDLLLVFEDDVILDPDQLTPLKSFFSRLNKLKVDWEEPLYIDVAGGMPPEQLNAHHLRISSSTGMDFYSKPLTNTVCGYMMNAKLAGVFWDMLINNPHLRLLNADWLVNTLFIKMERMGVSCTCIHANPSVFIHGSAREVYSSWMSEWNG